MTEQATAVCCYAKNPPRHGRRNVHLALAGDDRALCGVRAGEGAPDSAVTCWTCKEAVLAPPAVSAAPDEAAVIAAAEAALNAGPPLVHIVIGNGWAAVMMPFNRLLISVVRGVPGARWSKPDKAWIIRAALADEAAARLRNAGARVSSEIV